MYANADAFAKVKADKEREATYGHDGTWVAHPGLVPVAAAVFDRLMPGPNQLAKRLPELSVSADDLLLSDFDCRLLSDSQRSELPLERPSTMN